MKLLREYVNGDRIIREYDNNGELAIVDTAISEITVEEVIETLTLNDINNKLDDITLMMLQQGGIIA